MTNHHVRKVSQWVEKKR